MSARVCSSWSLARLAPLALIACSDPAPVALPPLGEVVVSVDTNAPVPELVSRLRVDFFDGTGRWFESRDILRGDVRDWPASFSVYSDDEQAEKTVILRVRGYLEGRLRRYQGEQFRGEQFVEPRAAQTLAELCDSPPLLKLGEELTLRKGRRTFTSHIPVTNLDPTTGEPDPFHSCTLDFAQGGAVAATLKIDQADDYRIETTHTEPDSDTANDTVILVRTSCAQAASQIACGDEGIPDESGLPNALGSITTHLDKGSYTVVALGVFATPSEITLRADLASAPRNPAVTPLTADPPAPRPRLLLGDSDITPLQEPQPLLAIDRLVRLQIVPGKKQLARVLLGAECAGTMARLSTAGSFADMVPGEAESCVSEEGLREPLAAEPLEAFGALPRHTQIGRFGLVEPCPVPAPDAAQVCVPAGSLVLGPGGATLAIGRFALLHRFWMDRTEVTVARWRAAVARGFVAPDATPMANDWSLATSSDLARTIASCTYSDTPLSGQNQREQYPVNCLTWYDARAFCRFEGGELPSEAQWEYAAAKAGRERRTRFPWTLDDGSPPSCDQAVFGRNDSSVSGALGKEIVCLSKGYGVMSVTDSANHNDRTPLGIQGLGGNVAEWTLDSWADDFSSSCWENATLVDPLCWQTEALQRTLRGGDASAVAENMLTSSRFGGGPVGYAGTGFLNVGLRCVYPEQP